MSAVLVLLLALMSAVVNTGSLRFFGNGLNDIDRVKMVIDNPADSNPWPPAAVAEESNRLETGPSDLPQFLSPAI